MLLLSLMMVVLLVVKEVVRVGIVRFRVELQHGRSGGGAGVRDDVGGRGMAIVKKLLLALHTHGRLLLHAWWLAFNNKKGGRC